MARVVVKIIAARGAAQLRRPGLLERQLKHGDAVRRQAWSSKAFVATILVMLVVALVIGFAISRQSGGVTGSSPRSAPAGFGQIRESSFYVG
jgi:hypothetical protein